MLHGSAGVPPAFDLGGRDARAPRPDARGARTGFRFAVIVAAALLSAPPARAAETIIAGGVSSGSTNLWPIHIGIRKGFFQAADIKIDLVFAQSNAGVVQQLAAGSIHVSVGSGLVDPIRAIDKGAPIALVRIETQKPPYALLAKPAIGSMRELKGKTVSVGGPKDITKIFLDRMLAGAGVAPRDVDLIFAGATSARMAALQSGAADAALLTTPYNFHAEVGGVSQARPRGRYGRPAVFRRRGQPYLGGAQSENRASLSGGLFAGDPMAGGPGQPA